MGKWATVLVVSICLAGCLPIGFLLTPQPEWPTVEGPETPSILAGSNGHVLSVAGDGTLEILRLRDGRVTEVRAPFGRRITNLAGPDRLGRILFVQAGSAVPSLMLTTVEGGKATKLLSREGTGSYWDQFAGLALSPTGGRFAFAVYGKDPGSSSIEIWNLDGPRLEQALPIDGSPSWSREGRLLVKRRVARDEVPPEIPHGPDEADWINRVDWRVWYELDTSTGETKPLVVSFDPPVPDLSRVPGLVHPVGALEGGLFVYWGHPTAGTEQRLQRTVQKVPERMLSLKIASCATGEYVTVIPYVGRFHIIRCGDVEPTERE